MAPLLELRDLSVTYRTAAGEVPAVRGRQPHRRRGPDAGHRRRVRLRQVHASPRPSCGCCRASARVTGQVLFEGEDILTMRWGQLRAVRWAGASIVFQGAMHSLNPVRSIGAQIAEPILLHEPGVDQRRGEPPGDDPAGAGRPARPGGPRATRTSCPAARSSAS